MNDCKLDVIIFATDDDCLDRLEEFARWRNDERRREDFVCWIRNVSKANWALCMPHRGENNEVSTMYPDFLIVLRERVSRAEGNTELDHIFDDYSGGS